MSGGLVISGVVCWVCGLYGLRRCGGGCLWWFCDPVVAGYKGFGGCGFRVNFVVLGGICSLFCAVFNSWKRVF